MRLPLLLLWAGLLLAEAAPGPPVWGRQTSLRSLPTAGSSSSRAGAGRDHATDRSGPGRGGAQGAQLRVIGGNEAAQGQLPWQAQILIDTTWTCGGSVISPMFVLTAAQCAVGFSQYKVTVGEVNQFYITSSTGQYAFTYKTLVHEDFEEDLWANDIGLLELLVPLQLNSGVQPINLPSVATETFVGRTAVSGWGEEDYGATSFNLRYALQPVMDTKRCARFYGNSPGMGGPTVEAAYHICGDGYNGAKIVGTCVDDVGDPLVVQEADDTWTQIGISSFQQDMIGCSYGYPSVYTRVTSYVDWIRKHANLPSPPSPTPSP